MYDDIRFLLFYFFSGTVREQQKLTIL